MKITHILLSLVVCASLAAQTTPELGIRDKAPDHVAFINARIIVSPDQTIDSAALVIKDGIIQAVGRNIAIPDGARTIDLQGKTVYPGFIDAFSEYGLPQDQDRGRGGQRRGGGPVYEGSRTGARAWNESLHPSVNWVAQFNPDNDGSESLMKLGFTTVQSGKRDGVLRGRTFVAHLGDGLPNDLVLNAKGNRSASFSKGNSPQDYPGSQMGAIALLRQTFLDTDWYLTAREIFKKNPAQKMPEYNRSIEALAGFRSDKFVFESDGELEIIRMDNLAREFGIDIIPVASGTEYRRIDGLKVLGRTFILPLNFPDKPTIKTLEDDEDVSLTTLRLWERAPSNPAVMEQAGIKFALTTQGLDKKSDFWTNLRKAIKHGLTEPTALAALTTIPSEMCGVSNLVGTLEKGKSADFFVADGNIFEKEVTVYSVWCGGRMKEFESLEQTDFRGIYELELAGKPLKLELKGDLKKVKGSFLQDTLKISLSDITVERTRIHFSGKLDTLGIDGLARFSGRLENNKLTGRWATAKLGDMHFEATRTGDVEEDKDEPDSTKGDEPNDAESKEKKEDGPPEFVSRLVFPMVPFGNETIPAQEDVLVRNATLWTVEDEGIIENCDMLIKDGLIAAIGPDLSAGSNVRVIDAGGRHVTPGIIDEHSHTAIDGDVNEGTHAVTSEVRIGDVIGSDSRSIYYALAGGTTTIRSLHGSANPIGGQAQIIKMRWGMLPEEMKFRKAPPSIKFALGENVKQSNWGEQFTTRYPQSRMGVEAIIRDAFQAAREYEATWSKYENLGRNEKGKTIPPRRDLQLEPLVEVLHSRMFITCHSYMAPEVLMLMRLADDFGFTVTTFTHILDGYKVAKEMAEHGAAASSFSDWWAYKFEVYDAIPYNTCILMENGVNTSINSDSPELGRRLNQEAAKSITYCGIAPEEAIKLCTINSAKMLKAEDHIGSLKVGKDADFVIWNDNPMSIYASPDETWVDGRKMFDRKVNRELAKIQEKEKTDLIQKILDDGSGDKDSKEKDGKRGRRRRPESGSDHADLSANISEGGDHETR